MAKFSTIVSQAAAFVSSYGLSTHNSIRTPDGQKVGAPSGARFARMTQADANTLLGNLRNYKYSGVSPFGAIVLLAKSNGVEWKAVRNAVCAKLGIEDNLLGRWTENTNNINVIVSGLEYAAQQLAAEGN